MNESAEKKKIIHQGRNVKIVRQSRGMYQKELAERLNKEQSEMSRIESLEIIGDELLNQIALVLEVPIDFLKNFDLIENADTYNNTQTNNTINSAENSQDMLNQIQGEQENIVNNNFPLADYKELTEKTMAVQEEYHQKEMQLLEEKYALDKENALLKQELEFLKNKK